MLIPGAILFVVGAFVTIVAAVKRATTSEQDIAQQRRGSGIEILEAVLGKPVRFRINNRPSSNDAWVGIYPVNAKDVEHGDRWGWLRDKHMDNASLPGQSEGRWSIRVFSDGGYTLHDRVDFDISHSQVVHSQVVHSQVSGKCEFISISEYDEVWNDKGSGAKQDVSVWRARVPAGCHLLGMTAKLGHSRPTFPTLVIRAGDNYIAPPERFDLVWWQERGKRRFWCWRPIPPPGYTSLGDVGTLSENPPSRGDVVCVALECLSGNKQPLGEQIWNDRGGGAPKDGAFFAQPGGTGLFRCSDDDTHNRPHGEFYLPGTMPHQHGNISEETETRHDPHLHDPEKAAEFARALGLSVGGHHPFVGDWGVKGLYAYRSGKYKGQAYFGTGGSESDRLKDTYNSIKPGESHQKYRPWNRDDPKIPEDIRQKLIRLEDRMNQTSQPSRNLSDSGGGLDGHYFSFKTGGNPNDIVDRFEARQDGNRVTYYRNGPVGSKSRVNSATANPMESYSISGSTLHGPVTGTIKPNGDIEYSHGYTSRKEGETTSSTSATHIFQIGWYRIETAEGSLIERVRVHQDKNHQARNEFIATGGLTGDVKWYVEGNTVKVPKFGGTGTIQADGNITWVDGNKAIYEENSATRSETILNSDGRKYVFAHEHNGWQWHNERARAMGGHLASITNGNENEQITRISGGAPVWIGGIRKGSGNGPGADHWYWDDGRPWSYTNWHPGEPNNHGGGENRVHLGLQAPGTWNDVPDQWHGPAVYLVPNIASETSKSSSPEIDILSKFKSRLDISDASDDFFTTDDYFDDLSSKFKKK